MPPVPSGRCLARSRLSFLPVFILAAASPLAGCTAGDAPDVVPDIGSSGAGSGGTGFGAGSGGTGFGAGSGGTGFGAGSGGTGSSHKLPSTHDGGSTLALAAATLEPGVERAAWSAQLEATGGTPPLRFEVLSGELPYGIRLDRDTGFLAGTLSRSGIYAFDVRAKDAAGQVAIQHYEVTIDAWNPAAQLGCGQSSTVTLSSSARHTNGGYQFQSLDEVAFFTVPLPAADTTAMVLHAESSEGDPALFVGRAGEPPGSELVAYYYLSSAQPGNEALRIDAGSSPSLADYQSNGSSLAGVLAATTPGEMTLSLECLTGAVLTTRLLPNAVPGQSYSTRLEASSSATFSAVSLPEGLELSADGWLTGALEAPGLYEVTVAVTDAAGAGETRSFQLWCPEVVAVPCDGQPAAISFSTRAFNGRQGLATPGGVQFIDLEVPEGASRVQVSVSHDEDFTVGLFYGYPGMAAGSSEIEDYIRGVFDSPDNDPDPVGWTFDSSDLPALEEYGASVPLAVAAQDGDGEATLTATCAFGLDVATRFIPNATVGELYYQPLSALGGTPPYLWTTQDPLPDGVLLDGIGALSGVPLTAGSFPLSFTVTDSTDQQVIRTLTLEVGGDDAVPGCGAAIPLTCDDYVSGKLEASAWVDRVEADFATAGGQLFYCLQFPEETTALELLVDNSSGDADVFFGYPGVPPGDREVRHYRRFSSLDGDDTLRLDDARYPDITAYGGQVAVAVIAYDPGQFLLSVTCE